MKIKKTDRIVKEGDPIFEKLKSLETHGETERLDCFVPRNGACVLHAAGFTEGIEANRSNRGQQEESEGW